jgi:glycogen operon protein
VTCHDGFTLNDLVSYNEKHNAENGEENRDGANDNRSWNCGVEGPSDDPGIERLRNRQVKNLLTVTLLSLGVPMLLMGDEVRRSQRGNNNAYCQDNDVSWFDWTQVARHADVHRFVMLLAERRARRDVEPELQRMSLARLLERANIAWHGVEVGKPDWSHHSHSLAVTAANREGGLAFHMMLNAYWESLDFMLPAAGIDNGSGWRRWIDTAQETPNDIVAWHDAPPVPGVTYRVESRSVVVLFAHGRRGYPQITRSHPSGFAREVGQSA